VRRALLVLGSLLCALLLAELLLRTFLPQPLVWNTSAIWEPIDGPGWRRRPNLNVAVNTGERTVRVISDARGHRIGTAPVAHADLEILAIGDSFVEALQVDAEQTMTALLAASLSRSLGQSVRVVNGGVGGWDANQYLIAAKRELNGAQYDLLLVFVFLENDVVARRVDSVPAARVTPPGLSAFLLAHSHLYVFGRNWMELRRMQSGTRRHLLTGIMRTEASSPDWRVTADVLADIAAEARARQTRVAYILIPPHHYIDENALASYAAAMGVDRSQLDVSQPARLLTAEVVRKGLTVFDATPALARADHAGRKDLYGRIDRHFSPAGHQVMADFLHSIAISSLVPHDGTH
jgi:lysophospholipase L1-like esterase